MTETPRRFVGGAFCVLFASFGAIPFARASAQAAGEVIVARDVKIPARGGALKARIFRPAGPALRPAILSIESDTSAAREKLARAFAVAGYAVVIAEPPVGDDRRVGRDGADAVAWIAKQLWSDHRIVLEGTGEGANAAWNIAREHPPQLAAMLTRAPSRFLGWSDEQFEAVASPALVIAGAYGELQGSAVGTFMRYTRATAVSGSRPAFLVIGTLGAADQQLLEKEYFDFTLGRGGAPPLLRGRVNYMEMGSGAWRSAESLEEIGAVPTSYPLHSFASTRTKTIGFLGESARDEEPADTLAAGTRVYETPVATAVHIAGFPSITLWLSAAATAKVDAVLEEVRADGKTVELGASDGLTRISETAAPGAPSRWEFSSFGWIATSLDKGSRLRLTLKAPPGVVVYHDVERYSRVILPVVKTPR